VNMTHKLIIAALATVMMTPPAMAGKNTSWAIVVLGCGNGTAANLPCQKVPLGDMPMFETEAKCKTALTIVSEAYSDAYKYSLFPSLSAPNLACARP
jgi:hypothetical protein